MIKNYLLIRLILHNVGERERPKEKGRRESERGVRDPYESPKEKGRRESERGVRDPYMSASISLFRLAVESSVRQRGR